MARLLIFHPPALQKKKNSLLPPPQRTRNGPSARPGRSPSRWPSPRPSPEGSGSQWRARTRSCRWRRGGARYERIFFSRFFLFFSSNTKHAKSRLRTLISVRFFSKFLNLMRGCRLEGVRKQEGGTGLFITFFLFFFFFIRRFVGERKKDRIIKKIKTPLVPRQKQKKKNSHRSSPPEAPSLLSGASHRQQRR